MKRSGRLSHKWVQTKQHYRDDDDDDEGGVGGDDGPVTFWFFVFTNNLTD